MRYITGEYRNLPQATWKTVSVSGAKTRNQWKRAGRKVKDGVLPDYVVPVREPGETIYIPVFKLERTKKYTPTRRTRAVWWFEDTFCINRFKYATMTDEGWRTSRTGVLSTEFVARHLNGSQTVAVAGGRTTKHLAIDFDLTSSNTGQAEHLRAVEIVLSRVDDILVELGARTWFVQVADHNAEGIHLYLVVDRPVDLRWARLRLRRSLLDIANRNPDLNQSLRDTGLRPISGPNPPERDPWMIGGSDCSWWYDYSRGDDTAASAIEIFPSSRQRFRLPLASGRTVILDRPLQRIDDKADVECFRDWVTSGKHPGLSVDDILAYYEERLIDWQPSVLQQLPVKEHETLSLRSAEKPKNDRRTSVTGSQPCVGVSAKNKVENFDELPCWEKLTGYWRGEYQPPNQLNRILLLSARILRAEEKSAQETELLLRKWCEQVPSPTSSRLTDPGKKALLIRDINTTVGVAFSSNGGLKDFASSTRKLNAVVRKWKVTGRVLSNPLTWVHRDNIYLSNSVEVTIPKTVLASLEESFVPLLSPRDISGRDPRSITTQIAKRICVALFVRSSHPLPLADQWFRKVFEDFKLRVGKKQKRVRLRQALEHSGLIEQVSEGNEFSGPSTYRLTEEVRSLCIYS